MNAPIIILPADEHPLPQPIVPVAMYSIDKLTEILTFSKALIYEGISEGWFPSGIKLFPRMVRWRGDFIRAWQDELFKLKPSADGLSVSDKAKLAAFLKAEGIAA
jgi:predicted DNA-binding transcriptional regulator AlpA